MTTKPIVLTCITVVLTLIMACSGGKTTDISTSANIVEGKVSPGETVLNFLEWYKNNRQRLVDINLIHNSTPSEDTTKLYAVNFEGTEHYLAELKKSGFVSDKYIESWRDYFNNAEQNFKDNPQYDGPPDYFDYDFVMLSQDFMGELEELNKTNISKEQIDTNTALVVLTFKVSLMKLNYKLSLIEGKWQIDDIENTSGQE